MPEFVSVRQGEKSKTVVTVPKEFAEGRGLSVLKNEPAVDRRGRPLGPRQSGEVQAEADTKEGSK